MEKVGKLHGEHTVVLTLTYNRGGYTSVMLDFVAMIKGVHNRYPGVTIELNFGGYAISAAAYVFAYFVYFDPHERIKVKTSSRLCLVYHKPRLLVNDKQSNTEILVFGNQDLTNCTPAEINLIRQLDKFFDAVFDSMLNYFEQKMKKPIDQHLIASYNSNGDASITYPVGLHTMKA